MCACACACQCVCLVVSKREKLCVVASVRGCTLVNENVYECVREIKWVCVGVCVCVCVRERERERKLATLD